MRRSLACWCLALLLVAAPAALGSSDVDDSDEYAEPDRAHIIAHKRVKLDAGDLAFPLVVQGRNVTVEVVLHNAGAGSASDVVYTDSLPSNAQLLAGALSVTYPKIASGSEVTHSYVVVFTSGGKMDVAYLPPGTVTYKAEADGTQQSGLTSKPGLFVLTPFQQIQRYALIVGTYASLGVCRTPIHWRNMAIMWSVIGLLVGVNWGVKQMGSSRTNTRRKKALEELQKDE